MTTNVLEYLDVRKRAAELGCNEPPDLTLLPANFETATAGNELVRSPEAATLKKLLAERRLPIGDIGVAGHRLPYVKNKSHDWIAPVLFVSASLYSQNPALVSVALSVIGNYATEFLRGTRGSPQVKLEVVVEKEKNTSYKRVSYEGPVEGLLGLSDVIREVVNE